MEKLLPLWVVLLAASVQGQGPSFYFPDQPQPPSSPQQQGQRSTQEVLGNFFNDNVNLPSITTSQPAYSSPQPQVPQFQPYQPQTFSTGQPPQFSTGFPAQNNFVTNSPPNNRPRQTSFFGNNYDFFRQFHLDAAPHRPSYQIQPFQTASPSFSSNVGNSRPPTPTAVTAPSPTASPSFTSTQFFGNTFPNSPARPAPTVTYNFINGQPAQNSLYNGFEDAAKALGVTHGLRVYTTATLKDNPTHTVATIPQNTPQQVAAQPTVGSIPENDQRIEDDALTLTPSSTIPPTPSSTSLPSSTTTTTTPPPPPLTTPAPVIIRNTGRSVATPIVRTKIISTSQSTPRPISSSTVATTFSTPKVVVVSHSRPPVTALRAFPGRDENDFEASAPQQPATNLVTTTPPVKAKAQSHPPPPRPTPTFSEERPLYNNANRLNPGQLYSNTNGAYQAYYNGPSAAPTPAGLEEIEPQIIDFNIPIHKMIPVLEEHVPFRTQEYDPYRRPNSFDNFGPPPPPFFSSQQQQPQQSRPFIPSPPQYVARPSPQPQIAVIVTEAAPSPTPATEGPVEVLRVGPKGRLLKKRRKVNKPQQRKASSTTTSEVTTYRPPVPQEQDEDQGDKQKQEPTTYRSRFRFSTTTSTSPPSPSSEGGAAASDGTDNSQQLIQSRLKSLERQIRFRHRNKNS
ncbi:extensin isoform X2 [Folsomia candida]|uniref:Uncharacterized protein n=1 Tax=Folsomia candida TaxID=158441 RepID=A0A226EV58_FOLCA|nr:extensin isoform X2 [Folsomia candida]OXA60486.1 hypothetical protein Fcan01_05073 [Folsomia candida]